MFFILLLMDTLDDLDPFFELAAFDTDLIDLQVDSIGWIDDGNYFREVQTGQDQFKQTHTFGSMGEFVFSYADLTWRNCIWELQLD